MASVVRQAVSNIFNASANMLSARPLPISEYITDYDIYFPVRCLSVILFQSDNTSLTRSPGGPPTFRFVKPAMCTFHSDGIQARYGPNLDALYPDYGAFAYWNATMHGVLPAHVSCIQEVDR